MHTPEPLIIEFDSAWIIRAILENESVMYRETVDGDTVSFQLFISEYEKREALYERLRGVAWAEKLARTETREECVQKKPMTFGEKLKATRSTAKVLSILSMPVWLNALSHTYDSILPLCLTLTVTLIGWCAVNLNNAQLTSSLEKVGITFFTTSLSLGMLGISTFLYMLIERLG